MEKKGKWWHVLARAMAVGGTMTVPGASGGTMAMILGIYEELIESMGSLPGLLAECIRCGNDGCARRRLWDCLRFLALFSLGALAGMALLAKGVLSLLERYPMAVSYFFLGAVAGGIPLICRQAQVKKITWQALFWPLAGLLMVYGLAALPEGKAYYQELLISQTGSYRSVEEIRQLLTAQFSREYEAVKKLAAEHPELLQYYTRETAPGFPYREASQMLLDLKQRMAEDFPPIPGGAVDVHVKAVSDSLADYCAPAFYLTAPLDDTASNTIYINRQKTPDGLELYTTLAHEGYPGHLYQTVYHNRSSLAAGERPARELLWYGGYQEGWALYVEFLSYQYAAELLRENGQETAALAAALEARNRSLQLCLYCVCDVLIHYEGASYSQIAKVLSGFGITDSTSMKAIYNYIVQTPCNYLKYYLGYLEILSLQEEAKELWGAEYTDYRFHSFFLDCGPADFASLGQWLAQTG